MLKKEDVNKEQKQPSQTEQQQETNAQNDGFRYDYDDSSDV